jgi:uncharacterized protein (DUF1501 family)
MNRRKFLLSGALLAASPWVRGASSTGTDWPRLLVILNRGGIDGASFLVPYGSDFYYASRPTIAIPKPVAGNAATAIKLSDYWGLHPAAKGLLPLWQKQQLAIVPFAGINDASRSHFDNQEIMELGERTKSTTSSGWMARLGALLHERFGTGAISFTGDPALALRGAVPTAPSIAVDQVSAQTWDKRQIANLTTLYAKDALSAAVREGTILRRRLLDILAERRKQPNVRESSGLEFQMRNVGALMRNFPEYALAFTEYGDGDTHAGQGASSGPLAQLFAQMSAGISGYAEEAGPAWDHTVIAVMSVFGRTIRENGTNGTDHGHGGVMLLAGGRLSEAGIVGRQVTVDKASLYQDRDWPVLNDFREVLAGPLQTLMHLDRSQILQVFPGLPSAGPGSASGIT